MALYVSSMKNLDFNLICKLWCAILLCTVILTGCDILSEDDNADIGIIQSRPSIPSVKPYRIDVDGIQGFAVVDNAPSTKAYTNTNSYALYNIDENGELQVSVFYFEVVQSDDSSTDDSYAEVLKEVSTALQIVPSLVTDLGKYILFSGCQYRMIASNISDEARAICNNFIWDNSGHYDITYMIRKSDGGLFDFTDQQLFRYSAFHDYCFVETVEYPWAMKWAQIAERSYMISAKENLFVCGGSLQRISKFEDNGNAIDVKQMTQTYGHDDIPMIRRFIVDNDENIYLFVGGDGSKSALHIYYANGGFNAYEFEPSLSNVDDFNPVLLNLISDEYGVPYVFLISNYYRTVEKVGADGSTYCESEYGQLFMSTCIKNGVAEPTNEVYLSTHEHRPNYDNGNIASHYYLGYYNNSFNWWLQYYMNPEYGSAPYKYKILSYDTNTHTCTLKEVPAELNQILGADYDAVTHGSKTYCANVKGTTIEVTEIDLVSETSRTYSLSVDMPTIVTPTYMALMIQDVPYLTINGRNTENGAGVSITVNLINGETNSSFAQDGRNVVSFFRIN